jgi:hypothetical protein
LSVGDFTGQDIVYNTPAFASIRMSKKTLTSSLEWNISANTSSFKSQSCPFRQRVNWVNLDTIGQADFYISSFVLTCLNDVFLDLDPRLFSAYSRFYRGQKRPV